MDKMCFFEICFYNDNSVPENNDESHRKRGYRILDRLQKNLSFLFMINSHSQLCINL